MKNPELTVYMAAPRGFCAGVDRAIKIVEMALEKWGEPVYVRHEIVHNKYVVDELKSKGVWSTLVFATMPFLFPFPLSKLTTKTKAPRKRRPLKRKKTALLY